MNRVGSGVGRYSSGWEKAGKNVWGKEFYVEEVTGGWLFAHTKTGSERFEVIGKR